MDDDAYKAFKAACAQVTAGSSKGTAYLVTPDHVATCAHVVMAVGEGGEVSVAFDSNDIQATVVRMDNVSDSAVLKLSRSPEKVKPLRLAGGCKLKSPWDGYGFPSVAKGAGIHIDGVVMDPDGKDDLRAAVLLLKSEQFAAGQASPLHGFSGSPVIVEGTVVGHIKRFIQDPESPLRPAYGYVYATPSSEVLKLLGMKPAIPLVVPPEPIFPASHLPVLDEGQYDVFLSYRSTDRAWATQLVSRLEGVGFKVFIDQRELLPGDPLANALQKVLSQSRAAVVVMSHGWLESPWCQEESNVLLHRTIENPSFRVVPVRIDDCTPPAMWQSRLWLDFSGKQGPEGPELRRLQYALIGRTPPPEDATENRVFKAETEATDELIREVRAAAATGPSRVFALWRKWREAEMPDGPASLHVAQSLIALGRPDQALAVLENARPGQRADQLRALALAKTEKIDDAIEILTKLYEANKVETDAETGGILAGRYKQKWKVSGYTDMASLRAAFEIYRETFDRTKDTYPGVNAAAMALWLDERAESGRLAQKVLLSLEGARIEEFDHWKFATFGEAYLLLSDVENAKTWYAKAVAKCPECHQDIAVMRAQAHRNLERLGLQRDMLDGILFVPCVAAFAGHMVDAPGRSLPRFPAEKVRAVREAIRGHLQELRIGYGFSSAARGSDLLFIEELLARGCRAFVYLPFPPETFKRTSVGYGWEDRFDSVLKHERVEVIQLADHALPEEKEPEAYEACNRRVLKDAKAKAKLLDGRPVLLTVWNGNPGDGVGGTADAVREWQNEGYEVDIIDISKL